MEEEIGLDKRERDRGFEGDHILIHDLHDSSDFKVFERVNLSDWLEHIFLIPTLEMVRETDSI